jgi:Flp pilus assembly protein TadG
MKLHLEVDSTKEWEVRLGIAALHALLDTPMPLQSAKRAAATSDAEADAADAEETPVKKETGVARLYREALEKSPITDAQLNTVTPTSVFTDEDVANATRELAATAGIPAATELLKQFAIERARDLPIERREEYVAAAKHRVTTHKATA